MELWTEMRTALYLGRLGTVKAAANKMGVHRATVSRHIDTLEEQLGTKLFTRHKHGYSLTDDGLAMIKAAEKAEDLFEGFTSDLVGTSGEMTGQLRVSSLSPLSAMIAPVIREFSRRHPKVSIRVDSTTDLAKLERGDAHIAIRTGQKPSNADYVVVPFMRFTVGLYAHGDYLREYGTPKRFDELASHRFIGRTKASAKEDFEFHVLNALSEDGVIVETPDPVAVLHNVLAGLGMGFISSFDAGNWSELVEVLPQEKPYWANLWIVTHVDVHRSQIVQEFISCLRQYGPQLD
ncbi:MAG: LysR family transcriptional regulator [Sphingomonadales bacterium]